MMKSYAVIGMGRFGGHLARRLSALGNEVLAMDVSQEKIQQIAGDVTQAVSGDSADIQVLRALGVHNLDCAIVAIGEDLAASVLTTLNLKELGVPMVVCKAQDDNHRKILEKIGADRVVVPEREYANKLAQGLCSTNVLEYIELSGDFGILEFAAPAAWVGKSLRQLNVRAKTGVNILAIGKGEDIQISFSADYVIEADDTILALGEYAALQAVQKK